MLQQAMRKVSPLSLAPGGSEDTLRVDSFKVRYRPDGSVEQFVSGLSVLDDEGRLLQQQDISVNHPLHYKVCRPPCCTGCCWDVGIDLLHWLLLEPGHCLAEFNVASSC